MGFDLNFVKQHTIYDSCSAIASELEPMIENSMFSSTFWYSAIDVDSAETETDLHDALTEFTENLIALFSDYGDESNTVITLTDNGYSDSISLLDDYGEPVHLMIARINAAGGPYLKLYCINQDNSKREVFSTANVTLQNIGGNKYKLTNIGAKEWESFPINNDGSRLKFTTNTGKRVSPSFMLSNSVKSSEVLNLLLTSIRAGLSGSLSASDLVAFINTYQNYGDLIYSESKQFYQTVLSSITSSGLVGLLSEAKRQFATYTSLTNDNGSLIDFAGAEPLVKAASLSGLWSAISQVVVSAATIVISMSSPILGLLFGIAGSLITYVLTGETDTDASRYKLIWGNDGNSSLDCDNRTINVSLIKSSITTSNSAMHPTLASAINKHQGFKFFTPGLETYMWKDGVQIGVESFISLDYLIDFNKTGITGGIFDDMSRLRLNQITSTNIASLTEKAYSPIAQGAVMGQREIELRLISGTFLSQLYFMTQAYGDRFSSLADFRIEKSSNFGMSEINTLNTNGVHNFGLFVLYYLLLDSYAAYSENNTPRADEEANELILDFIINFWCSKFSKATFASAAMLGDFTVEDVNSCLTQLSGFVKLPDGTTGSYIPYSFDTITSNQAGGSIATFCLGLLDEGMVEGILKSTVYGPRSSNFFVIVPKYFGSSVLKIIAAVLVVTAVAVMTYLVARFAVRRISERKIYNLRGKLDADYKLLTSGSLDAASFKTVRARYNRNSMKFNLLSRICGFGSYNRMAGLVNSPAVNPTGRNPGVDSQGNLIDGMTSLTNNAVIASMLGINPPDQDFGPHIVKLITGEDL